MAALFGWSVHAGEGVAECSTKQSCWQAAVFHHRWKNARIHHSRSLPNSGTKNMVAASMQILSKIKMGLLLVAEHKYFSLLKIHIPTAVWPSRILVTFKILH